MYYSDWIHNIPLRNKKERWNRRPIFLYYDYGCGYLIVIGILLEQKFFLLFEYIRKKLKFMMKDLDKPHSYFNVKDVISR